jgi:hypothetical protein
LFTAAAIGAIAIGSASALPLNNSLAALGESQVVDVRMVCNQRGQCYNTRRSHRSMNRQRRHRSVRRQFAPSHQVAPAYGYYGQPDDGYYGRPQVGIGIGPFDVIVR